MAVLALAMTVASLSTRKENVLIVTNPAMVAERTLLIASTVLTDSILMKIKSAFPSQLEVVEKNALLDAQIVETTDPAMNVQATTSDS